MPFYFNAVDNLLSPFRLIDEQLFDIPANRMFRVENNYHKILIMLDGDCYMSINGGERIRFSTGGIFVFDQVCIQDYFPFRCGKGCRLHILRLVFSGAVLPPRRVRKSPVALKLSGDTTRDPVAFIRHCLSVTKLLPGGLTPDIQECLAKIRAEAEEKPAGYRGAVSALCFYLVALIGRKFVISSSKRAGLGNRGHSNVIAQCKSFIAANLAQPLSLRDVAWHFGWSEEHFSRVFKSVTGQTPAQYIRQSRLEIAKNHLLNGRDAITYISKISGFSSLSVFSRCFQHYVGTSPAAYREKDRFGRVL